MIETIAIASFLQLPFQLEPLTIVIVLLVVAVFVGVVITNRFVLQRLRQSTRQMVSTNNLMQKAFKISANNVVEFDLRRRYIYRLSGHLLPEEGLPVDVWKTHLHPDDLEATLQQFQRMMNGELKEAEFYYRWNLDYSGGRPRWGYIHNRSIAEFVPGHSQPMSIISSLSDETKQREQQEEERQLSERYRQIFENSIIGLSFYSPDGWLLNSNAIMRQICHFDSEEGDAHFSNTNLFDAAPFNEVLDRNNVQDMWMCSLSVVPERGMHLYLEIRVRPIRDDEGRLMYISIAVRDVSEERQLYLQAKQNDIEIQKVNEAIQLYETELRYMMEACDMRAWRLLIDERKIQFYQGLSTVELELSFDELPDYFIDSRDLVARRLKDAQRYYSKPMAYMSRMRSLFHDTDEEQWNQINSVPIFDENGRLTATFGLLRNITNLMKKQEQLKHETERANESGHLKSVFLANMTHEIRTPLNAIVGFSDLLQAIESPDDKREMIRIIHNNCDMLLRLINDILVLSNVDANAMQIEPQDIDCAMAFDDLCQSLAQRVQNPAVEFIKENPYVHLRTRLDSARINQVLTNFVTNAVKYTQQGHIRLGYRIEERHGHGGFYAYCEDTGAGIPADQQKRIFERFVKLNDFVQGTGLGLSICKAIIEKCGGEIGVDSEVGAGSTFWFWVPADILSVEHRT